jgi:GAF domain-containing protein
VSQVRDRVPVRSLAEEQAALRRVATLVAEGATAAAVFAAVAEEVAQVMHLENAAVGRFDDEAETMTIVAVWDDRSHGFGLEPGTRWPLDGPSMSAEVFRTGRPARVEDYTKLSGSLAAEVRASGLRRMVGAPILVDGRVWGLIATSSRDAPFPDDIEDRLAEFTELVATAIANSQAREELTLLAEEQAALRRVATLVAQGAPPAEVFAAVSAEVARLVPADGAALTRFEADGTVTALGGWTSPGGYVYVGKRYPLEGTVSGLVFETGRPARIDNYADQPGTAAVAGREMGWRSSVGVPITVEGRLWGVLAVASTTDRPLPHETDRRLAEFTELVATAIANAGSREELTLLAEEQTALRRVATLVARGVSPTEVLDAVAAEVERLLGADWASVHRCDPDGVVTVVSSSGSLSSDIPVGPHATLDPTSVVASVMDTGRPARIESYDDVSGEWAARARALGVRAVVGAPIMVEGSLWGVTIACWTQEGEVPVPDAENLLAGFTELVATAIANSEAHEQLAQLADEQAALRRVATLVAEGATPQRVFDGVRDEVARVFNTPLSVLLRYDANGTATVLATSDGYLGPIGRSWPVVGDGSAIARVCRTGLPARADYTRAAQGSIPAAARAVGARSAVGVPVVVDGTLWGVMAVGSRETEPLPADFETRLAKFTELLATAIANAEGRGELEASRARIVATADATRRKIERDLHDGAQQRLVSLSLQLRAAEAAVPPELGGLRVELSQVVEGQTGVLEELREIAQGIHPATLAEGGLAPALRMLARRSPIPVEHDVRVEDRLPEPVEVAAYYVVSEALANVAKHACASLVHVAVAAGDGVLRVAVRDNGLGGADPAVGSGLVGLKDRAEAIGGKLSLESPPGAGTSLLVELPVDDRHQ